MNKNLILICGKNRINLDELHDADPWPIFYLGSKFPLKIYYQIKISNFATYSGISNNELKNRIEDLVKEYPKLLKNKVKIKKFVSYPTLHGSFKTEYIGRLKYKIQ